MVGAETKNVGARSFADVLPTPTLAALLMIFAEQPEQHFMQKELVERSGNALYLVQREFKRLEGVGLISRKPCGRHDGVEAVTTDRHFVTAYNAALQLATIPLRAEGCRTSGSGHHFTTITLLTEFLGAKMRSTADYLNACRAKRNAATTSALASPLMSDH